MIKFIFQRAAGSINDSKEVCFSLEGLTGKPVKLVIENATHRKTVYAADLFAGERSFDGKLDLGIPKESPQTAITCFATLYEVTKNGDSRPIDMAPAVYFLENSLPTSDFSVAVFPQYVGVFDNVAVKLEAKPNERYTLSLGAKKAVIRTDARGVGTFTVPAYDIATERTIGVTQRYAVQVYDSNDNYSIAKFGGSYVSILPSKMAKLVDCDPWEPDESCLETLPSVRQASLRTERPGPDFPPAIASTSNCTTSELFQNKVTRVEDCSAALLPNGHFVYCFVGPDKADGSLPDPKVWVGNAASAYALRSLPMRFGVVPPSESVFELYVEKEIYDKVTSPTSWEVQIRHADFGYKKFSVVSRHAPDSEVSAYRLKLDMSGLSGGIDSWYLCLPFVLFSESANGLTLGLQNSLESLPHVTDLLGNTVPAIKASIATSRSVVRADDVCYVYVIASALVDGVSQLFYYAFTLKATSGTSGSYTKETFGWKQITLVGENKNPKAICDDSGNLHIFWESDRSGSSQIYYAVLGPQAYSLGNAALSSAVDKQAQILQTDSNRWTEVRESLFSDIQPVTPLGIPQFCEDLEPEYLSNNLWIEWSYDGGQVVASDNATVEINGNPFENSAMAFTRIDRNIDGSYFDGKFSQRSIGLSFALKDNNAPSPLADYEIDQLYSQWKSQYVPVRDEAANNKHIYVRNGNKMTIMRTGRYFDRFIPIAASYKNQLLSSLYERCITDINREFTAVASGCNGTLRHFMLGVMPEKVRFKAVNTQTVNEYCEDGGSEIDNCESSYIPEEEVVTYTGRFKLVVLMRSDGYFYGSRSRAGFTLVREVGEPFALNENQRFELRAHYRKLFFEDNAIWSGASVQSTQVDEPKFVASLMIARNETPVFAESFLVDLSDQYRSFDISLGFPAGGQYLTRENLPYQTVVYDDREVNFVYTDIAVGVPNWSLSGNLLTMPDDYCFFPSLSVADTQAETFAHRFDSRYNYLNLGIESNGIPEIPITFEGINKNVGVALGSFCNDLHIVWQSNRSKYWDIYYTSSANKFLPFRYETQITNSTSNSIMPSISLDGDGNRLVVWSDNRDGRYQIYASKAGPVDGACSFSDCELYSGIRVQGATDLISQEQEVNNCVVAFEFCNEPCDYDISLFDPCSTLSWCDPPSVVGGEVNSGTPVTLRTWSNSGVSHDNDEDNAIYCSRLFIWKCAKHDGTRYDFSDAAPVVLKTFYARSSGNVSGVKDATDGPFYSNGPLTGSLLNVKPYWFAECGIGGYELTESWWEPSEDERVIIYNHAVAAAGVAIPPVGERHTLIVQLLFFRKELQEESTSQVKLARLFVYDCELEGYLKAIKCSCDVGGPDEVFINRADLP